MLNQKAYRNGNSLTATLPKEYAKDLGIRDGSEILVAKENGKITIAPKKKKSAKHAEDESGITPEFKKWLDDITKENEDLIKELAKR